MKHPYHSLVQALTERAAEHPDKDAYIFLADGEADERCLSYGRLHASAGAVAARLREHVAVGDRVLLLCPPGLEFIEAFFGCLYAGAIAVPAFPPDSFAVQRVLSRIDAIAVDCAPAAILTTADFAGAGELIAEHAPALRGVPILDVADRDADAVAPPLAVQPGDVAFLQYTSGSTGSPKGVVLTHGNLLANEAMINEAMPQDSESTMVSWLPLFHDMGLIGVVLNTVYLGARCVLMAPYHFIERPKRWLDAVTKYRARVTGGPNFGFELCLRKISADERRELDLSSVEVMFNGAEPIRADTLERFGAAFADCGLRPDALTPCYGLAEATLIVSSKPVRALPTTEVFDAAALEEGRAVPAGPGAGAGARALVGVGTAADAQSVQVVDVQTGRVLPPGRLGEIWVAGDHVGQGYWRRAEQSAETFAAELDGDADGVRYLRTGDFGFLHEGELFISGRLKDLLIVRGRNLAPQDLELAAEQACDALRPGCSAIFQVDRQHADPLVVAVHEWDPRSPREYAEAIETVRARVVERFEVELDAVVLVAARTIPKTSSGKIQRSACRLDFERDRLSVVARWDSPDARADTEELAARIEQTLRALLASTDREDGAAPLPAAAPLPGAALTPTDLGVDSMTAIQIRAELQRELGIDVRLAELFQGRDLSALALRVARGAREADIEPLVLQQGSEFPLSDGQLALWYLHEQAPHSTAYNIRTALRVDGPLDVERLRGATAQLVERHELLRTRFDHQGGAPFQQILSSRPLDFAVGTGGTTDQVREWMAAVADEPFDLGADPLLRVRVHPDHDGGHLVLLVVHHIIADFWSLAQYADELGQLYAGLDEARASAALEPIGHRYADFVRAQRTWLGSPQAHEQLEAWIRTLTPLPEPLNLPTDRPRPAIRAERGDAVTRRLDRAVAHAASRIAAEHGTTPYVLILTAFDCLLHSYTGQTDIVVGSPSSVRTRPEFADVLGYFVNTLPIRVDVGGDPVFSEALGRVRTAVLGALDRQEVPFVRIVERLQPPRDPSRTPVFQAGYTHQQSRYTDPARAGLGSFALGEDGARADLHGLPVESFRIDDHSSQFDLQLMSALDDDGLSLSLRYDTALFDRETASRMLGHLENLLRRAVEDPSLRLSEFELLSAQESAQIAAWNDTRRDYEGHGWIHEEFVARAAQSPDAVALVFQGRSMTYADLDLRSNRLAHRLRRAGVGPESFVAVAIDRSFDLVVAQLAVLKAGAAYVPIDLDSPAERLTYVLSDAEPAVVLCVSGREEAVAAGSRPTILVDDDQRSQPGDDGPVAVKIDGGTAAYMIYTSGSTGAPKGAITTHEAIRNRLVWMQETYRLEVGDRVVQKTPSGFDVSVWEFFWPLMTGATMVVARPGGHRDAEYLAQLIQRERVTVAHFVPTMLAMFLAEADATSCTSLRQVVCSGESLSADLAQRFHTALPSCPLDNLYGPTEAAIDVTRWRYQPSADTVTVPIGRPVANVSLRIVDAHGRQTPVGVPGELCIGGVQLARGYHRRPELTKERFVPDPWAAEPGARLYRTGDIARWRPDGAVEYLGRSDHQVKIHGNRVELGEIEHILGSHPDVEEAVVVTAGTGADARLIAYVRPAATKDVGENDLRTLAGLRLPQYMIPHLFVFLAEFPTTVSGKVDRRALPEPDGAARPRSAAVSPRTPAEQLLCRIIAGVLELPEVGITDNFFEIGGDSIRALRVRAACRQAGLDVELADLMRFPTPERLAAVAVPVAADAAPRVLPFALVGEQDRAALPAGAVDAYPLARLQEGLAFHSESSQDYEIYVMGFHFGGGFDASAMTRALAGLAERHELLRTSYDFDSFSQSLQIVHAQAEIPMTVHDLTDQPESAHQDLIDRFMREEKWRRFDWTKPPFLRVAVHVRSPESFQVTFSHPLFDGWSMALLITELMGDYGAYSRSGRPEPRAELGLRYADFVAAEQQAVQSPEHQRFWAEYLASSERGEIPRWPSRRSPAPARHRRTTVPVPRETADALRRLASECGTSLKSVVLAAHLRVVSLLTGRPDVTAGVIANGRLEELDGERVPGVYLNTVPLRLAFDGGTWRDLVRQAFAAEREVLPFRRYPLAELVRTVGGGQPLFDTGFNYIHFHIYEALSTVEGLEVRDWTSPSDQTYFPLTAYFHSDIASGELLCFLDIDDAVFDPAQAEAIQGYYSRALSAMAESPDSRYERCRLLSPDEAAFQLRTCNQTTAEPIGVPGAHRRFAAIAAEHPTATAVRAVDGELDYAALDARSNQLARRLLDLGAGPKSTVGIALGRSLDLTVALLAVLKTGAAYVPMDPRFPQERLQFMAEDSGATVIITDAEAVALLPATAARLFRIDDEDLSALPTDPPNVAFDPDALAYVIYTSGSTGRPKGVEISHRALDNLLTAFHREFAWNGPQEAWLAVTTLSFDIAALELFLPLTTGARLELAGDAQTGDPDALTARIAAGVTTMQATPATWRMLIDSGWTGSAGLRVVCGGEALTAELADALRPRCGELWNVYGPTETTIWSSAVRIDAVEGTPTIGHPIANTSLHVLDVHGEPVPLGTPGELFIGGAGLARGYRNRPDLTSAAFSHRVLTPGAAPTRLYRTGDLVRRRPDGALEYLGRLDSQVKVRGYRIELGEIEAVLGREDRIRQAVAAVRADHGSEASLVAYVVPREPGDALGTEVLRDLAAASLPAYMVPSHFVVMEELPHTPNGKVDRKALPAPTQQSAGPRRSPVAPRSDLERRLTQIWEQVLGVDGVGIDDHFFELGGHSLLLVRMQARIRQRIGDVSLLALYEHSTIRHLAGHLADHQPAAVDDRLARIAARAGSRRSTANRVRSERPDRGQG